MLGPRVGVVRRGTLCGNEAAAIGNTVSADELGRGIDIGSRMRGKELGKFLTNPNGNSGGCDMPLKKLLGGKILCGIYHGLTPTCRVLGVPRNVFEKTPFGNLPNFVLVDENEFEIGNFLAISLLK